MKTTIAVYDAREKAVAALTELKRSGYPAKRVSILGQIRDADLQTDEKIVNEAGRDVGLSVLVGSTLGVLTGVGVFAIPGLGFLFGAGALVGAIAGFDFGLIGGGIISALSLSNVEGDIAKKYEEEIKAGKFLVIAQGTAEELDRANAILHAHGGHTELGTH